MYANKTDVTAIRKKIGMVFRKLNPFGVLSTRMWHTGLGSQA